MKLFECDTCSRKLKCALLNKRLDIIKKYCGTPWFKKMWDEVDKVTSPLDIGWKLGLIFSDRNYVKSEEARAEMRAFLYEEAHACIIHLHDEVCRAYIARKDKVNDNKTTKEG